MLPMREKSSSRKRVRRSFGRVTMWGVLMKPMVSPSGLARAARSVPPPAAKAIDDHGDLAVGQPLLGAGWQRQEGGRGGWS